MGMSPKQLKIKRAYRDKKRDEGKQRIVSYIPEPDYNLIVEAQEELGLRTRGHAISAIIAEWQKLKQEAEATNS